MKTNLPTSIDLQTANQVRIGWTVLAVVTLLCALEQVLVLAQSGAHVCPVQSQSKAYVVAAASHYLFLFYVCQASLTLQHIRLAQVPPFPCGFTEAVRAVTGFRSFTDKVLVWLVPVLLVVFFAKMLTYQVYNIDTGELLVDSAYGHLVPDERLRSKALNTAYAGTRFMIAAGDAFLGQYGRDVLPEATKRVSYFPIFAPYALLIEALVAIWLAWRTERARREVERAHPGRDPRAPIAIFISYRRADTAYVVDRLSHTLAEEFGRESVFRDLDLIRLGESLNKRIAEAIDKASVVLAVIGKEWLKEQQDAAGNVNKDWVVLELSLALEKQKPLIPILVEPATLPEAERLPDQIRRLPDLNALKLHPDPYYAPDLNRLLARVGEIVGNTAIPGEENNGKKAIT